jgi:predicted Zn-dependent peptidase
MKKLFLILVVIILVFLLIGAQAPPAQTPQAKPEDFAKNLVRVEKPESVPEQMKAGFEAIAAKDSLAMLSFIASDLLEGRETGTRSFQYLREATESGLGFGSSDHASFHEAKIPWLLTISAVTEDLHQTSDSVDKVSGELIEKVSKLMYAIAFQLAQK